MKILLDENFPLPLYYRLRAAGHEVEHIIVLGQRGVPDSVIRQRLEAEDLVLLTQDTEFEEIPTTMRGKVVISRVSQNLRIQRRVEIWFHALQEFIEAPPKQKLFELLETGDIVPWEIREL